MIMNPVIQGGGAEKVYKITDNALFGFPKSAKAGEILRTETGELFMGIEITTRYGDKIPYEAGSGSIYATALCFVMPSEDVEITAL